MTTALDSGFSINGVKALEDRIKALEKQIASLTAENQKLASSLGGVGNAAGEAGQAMQKFGAAQKGSLKEAEDEVKRLSAALKKISRIENPEQHAQALQKYMAALARLSAAERQHKIDIANAFSGVKSGGQQAVQVMQQVEVAVSGVVGQLKQVGNAAAGVQAVTRAQNDLLSATQATTRSQQAMVRDVAKLEALRDAYQGSMDELVKMKSAMDSVKSSSGMERLTALQAEYNEELKRGVQLSREQQAAIDAIRAVSGGQQGVRVRIADVFEKMQMPKAEFDQLLMKLERLGHLSMYRIDDPDQLTARDIAHRLVTPGGTENHIIYEGGLSSDGAAVSERAMALKKQIDAIKASMGEVDRMMTAYKAKLQEVDRLGGELGAAEEQFEEAQKVTAELSRQNDERREAIQLAEQELGVENKLVQKMREATAAGSKYGKFGMADLAKLGIDDSERNRLITEAFMEGLIDLHPAGKNYQGPAYEGMSDQKYSQISLSAEAIRKSMAAAGDEQHMMVQEGGKLAHLDQRRLRTMDEILGRAKQIREQSTLVASVSERDALMAKADAMERFVRSRQDRRMDRPQVYEARVEADSLKGLQQQLDAVRSKRDRLGASEQQEKERLAGVIAGIERRIAAEKELLAVQRRRDDVQVVEQKAMAQPIKNVNDLKSVISRLKSEIRSTADESKRAALEMKLAFMESSSALGGSLTARIAQKQAQKNSVMIDGKLYPMKMRTLREPDGLFGPYTEVTGHTPALYGGKPFGYVGGSLKDGVMRVNTSQTDPSLRGQNTGLRMYAELIQQAIKQGAHTFSSDQQVSAHAQSAWRKLSEHLGVQIRRNMSAAPGIGNLGGGKTFDYLQSADGEGVFSIDLTKIDPARLQQLRDTGTTDLKVKQRFEALQTEVRYAEGTLSRLQQRLQESTAAYRKLANTAGVRKEALRGAYQQLEADRIAAEMEQFREDVTSRDPYHAPQTIRSRIDEARAGGEAAQMAFSRALQEQMSRPNQFSRAGMQARMAEEQQRLQFMDPYSSRARNLRSGMRSLDEQGYRLSLQEAREIAADGEQMRRNGERQSTDQIQKEIAALDMLQKELGVTGRDYQLLAARRRELNNEMGRRQGNADGSAAQRQMLAADRQQILSQMALNDPRYGPTFATNVQMDRADARRMAEAERAAMQGVASGTTAAEMQAEIAMLEKQNAALSENSAAFEKNQAAIKEKKVALAELTGELSRNAGSTNRLQYEIGELDQKLTKMDMSKEASEVRKVVREQAQYANELRKTNRELERMKRQERRRAMGFFGGTIDRLRSPIFEGGDGGGQGIAGSIGGQVKTLAATYLGLYQAISSLTQEINRDRERRKAQFMEGIEGDREAARQAPNLGARDLPEFKRWAQQNQDAFGATTQQILQVAGFVKSMGLVDMQQIKDFTGMALATSVGDAEIAKGVGQIAVSAMRQSQVNDPRGAIIFARQFAEQSAGENEAIYFRNIVDRFVVATNGAVDKEKAVERVSELLAAASKAFSDTSGDVSSRAMGNILQALPKIKLEESTQVNGESVRIDRQVVEAFNKETDALKRLDVILTNVGAMGQLGQQLERMGLGGDIVERVSGEKGPLSAMIEQILTSQEFRQALKEAEEGIMSISDASKFYPEYMKQIQEATGNLEAFNQAIGVINKATTTDANTLNGAVETAFEKGMANVDLKGLFGDEIISGQMTAAEEMARMEDAKAGMPENTAAYKVAALDVGIASMRAQNIPDYQEDLALMLKLRAEMEKMSAMQFEATFPERQAAGRLIQNESRISAARAMVESEQRQLAFWKKGNPVTGGVDQELVAMAEQTLADAQKELAAAIKEQTMLMERLEGARLKRVRGFDPNEAIPEGVERLMMGISPLGVALPLAELAIDERVSNADMPELSPDRQAEMKAREEKRKAAEQQAMEKEAAAKRARVLAADAELQVAEREFAAYEKEYEQKHTIAEAKFDVAQFDSITPFGFGNDEQKMEEARQEMATLGGEFFEKSDRVRKAREAKREAEVETGFTVDQAREKERELEMFRKQHEESMKKFDMLIEALSRNVPSIGAVPIGRPPVSRAPNATQAP